MTTIKIFKDKTEINLEKLIETRMLILANSGGGKSYAFRKLLEEINNKVMVIILDVEGEYKTLREKYDYLLIGGEGDVPINTKSANLLPKKLFELGVSTIIDISELKSKERILYVKKFLESLMELPRKYWKPCIIGVEETHKLCGQQDKHDSGPAVIDLFTRGRKRGLCGVAITQRIAKLHKDVVAECNNFYAGRMWLPNDIKTASQIFGISFQEAMKLFKNLEPGELFCFGPAINKNVHRGKIGVVKTTHPRPGIDLKKHISPPTDKIKKLLSKINDLPKEAEVKLREKKDYISKIRQLETELRIVNKKSSKTIVKDLSREQMNEFKIKLNELQKENKVLSHSLGKKDFYMKQAVRKIVTICNQLLQEPVPNIKKPVIILKESPTKIDMNKPFVPAFEEDEELKELGKCAKMVYGFLLANPVKKFTRTQLGLLTGYSYKSGGFQSALASLNTRSMIIKEGDRISLNPNNIDNEIDEQEEYSLKLIKKKLGKCAGEILDVLLENPSEEYTREELATDTPTQYSHTSGGFQSALAKLNVLGLIEKTDSKIKLNPDLEGLT